MTHYYLAAIARYHDTVSYHNHTYNITWYTEFVDPYPPHKLMLLALKMT